ncbi:MAG: thiamine pyrophosphate-binding protein [Deltaproteobacteria bacterium]|nr:MAG: thiamine pyrophosphate-binding protein [Deltaproteobacteria bacterium]
MNSTHESSAFFEHFDRHAHGKGLKGASTHYCAGCGHGLAHKFLSDAITTLGVQDRTVAVSPVGCSVFLYYYFDVGNTQAAHGRAPAVALGHKMANPDSIVVSYQGDGDLASIGLAEIMHAAQLGVPITVIFVNNAIYGMTGGQMAPTTLPGQWSTTCPTGRGVMEGAPLKVAELIAGLDGPIYVERVALYDQRRRKAAHKAIEKALRLQVEGRGFAFVEVLSECPTHLKMTPEDAEHWVRDTMTKTYPLGVLKEVERDPWFEGPRPKFDVSQMVDMIEAIPTDKAPPRFGGGFPTHLDPEDVALKLAGAGGDGAQTAAMLIARAAIREGHDATHIPSYGPESRGGTSYADLHIAKNEVLSPGAASPHVLVAFNAPSLKKFGPTVRAGGVIVYDSSVITDVPPLRDDVRAYGVPLASIARDLGVPLVKNVVALGAVNAAAKLLPDEALLTTLRQALKDKCALLASNEAAFAAGRDAVLNA